MKSGNLGSMKSSNETCYPQTLRTQIKEDAKKLNGKNLRRMMSPKRLSHISEKSADELVTVLNDPSNKKVTIIRRSSSVG